MSEEAVWPALLAGERQKGETRRAIITCNDYLLMGPGRSLKKLWEEYRLQTESKPSPPTKRLATLKAWSARYNWQRRAELYDAEQERLKAEKVRSEIEAMCERQARQAFTLQTAGMHLLKALLERVQHDPQALNQLTVQELLNYLPSATRALEVGAREERQARGQPGDRVDLTSQGQKISFKTVIVEVPREVADGNEPPNPVADQ